MLGGVNLEKGVRLQVTLAPAVAEKLDRYCQDKGLRRSAALALALDKLWREEQTDEK